MYLDLGNVQVIAQVKLNGKDLGILWKTPVPLDVTDAVQAGDNALEVRVTNNWVNRLIGDEQLPGRLATPSRAATWSSGRSGCWKSKPSPTGPAHVHHLASLAARIRR